MFRPGRASRAAGAGVHLARFNKACQSGQSRGGAMKIAVRALLTVLMAIGFAAWSAAQMGMGRPPSIAGVFKPVVGSGASYEMTRKNGEKSSFDMYVVDKEAGGYWIEYGMEVPQMHGTMYSKMLLVR